MFDVIVYRNISEGLKYGQILIENPEIIYTYTKRDFEVTEREGDTSGIEKRELARVTFYKHPDGSKLGGKSGIGSFINYRMYKERNICKSPLSNIKGFSKETMNYLLVDCNITDREYCRTNILKSIKTSTNYKLLEPSEDLKRLNISLTKMIINNTFLKNKGWNLRKWCKNENIISNTGNLYHIKIDVYGEDSNSSDDESIDDISSDDEIIDDAISSDDESIDDAISSDDEIIDDASNSSINEYNNKCKQKKKGTNLQPGGGLYLYTHQSWNKKDNIIENNLYRWGKCEQDSTCLPRLKGHAYEHPIDPITVVGLWSVDCDVIRRESEVSKKLQDLGMQYDALATSTSDYYMGSIEEIKEIINSILPPNSELPDTEYPDIYKD